MTVQLHSFMQIIITSNSHNPDFSISVGTLIRVILLSFRTNILQSHLTCALESQFNLDKKERFDNIYGDKG
jgi:hypothetical protein